MPGRWWLQATAAGWLLGSLIGCASAPSGLGLVLEPEPLALKRARYVLPAPPPPPRPWRVEELRAFEAEWPALDGYAARRPVWTGEEPDTEEPDWELVLDGPCPGVSLEPGCPHTHGAIVFRPVQVGQNKSPGPLLLAEWRP